MNILNNEKGLYFKMCEKRHAAACKAVEAGSIPAPASKQNVSSGLFGIATGCQMSCPGQKT
uniref:Uncharacterized protein n=1 Tax=mine drainage metagenome TaxID=410659 RepID=E6Q9W1_9ZZZZ